MYKAGGSHLMIEKREAIQTIIKELSALETIRPEEVPDIALYMDQVTTFMEDRLKNFRRYDDDKIMTKTMINNYAKSNLIPSPEKKKYSKDHVLLFILIYYLKSFLSITDIEKLFSRITEDYFNAGEGHYDLQNLYASFCDMVEQSRDDISENILSMLEKEDMAFDGIKEDDEGYFHLLAFILRLSLDVYIKKQLIERLIDRIPEPESRHKKSKSADT